MGDLVVWLIAVGVILALWGAIALLRRRPPDLPSTTFGVFDELYNPAAQRARVEMYEEQERGAARPSADDRPFPGDDPDDPDAVSDGPEAPSGPAGR